jgi:general secretion pathway protein K
MFRRATGERASNRQGTERRKCPNGGAAMKSILRDARSRKAPDGFILIAVLWILGALATLATIYAVYVTHTAVGLSVIDDRLQAEGLISAGLELTALQLTTTTTSAPLGGTFDFRLGSANVNVEFRSETARIDLNMASKELLAGLFSSLSVQHDSAEGYADRIVAWRSPPGEQDQEASKYRAAGRRYLPRGARFPHVDELSLLLIPPELVARVIPYVTVYSGRPEINVLAAEPQLLAAVPGMNPDLLTAILTQRRALRPDLPSLAAMLGPARTHATTDSGLTTRVTIQIRFDNGRMMNSEVVIMVLQGADEPYRVMSWRDDLD